MAVTRITAMHLNKGRIIAQCLKDRTDYAKNPGKSERCLFIFTKFIEPVVVIQESRNVVGISEAKVQIQFFLDPVVKGLKTWVTVP